MPPQMQRPITCPICGSPIIIVADSFTCPYCLISEITWTPIKSIDRTKFTQKELDEKMAKEKERQKQLEIEMNKRIHEQKLQMLKDQEGKNDGKTSQKN